MTTGTRDTRRDVLVDAVARASCYLATVNDRPVAPPASALAALSRLGGPLQEEPVEHPARGGRLGGGRC